MVACWNLFSGYNRGGGSWWHSRERFWKSSNGTNVQPAKQWHGNLVEVDNDRGLLGKFLRERNQSHIKDHLV